MGFLVSPGVEVKEVDLTNVIPALSTSIGGFAGEFKWGSADELITVSSENDLQQIFGKPDSTVSKSFLQAAGFLKYGNTLKVSRVVKEIALKDSSDADIVDIVKPAAGVDSDTISASAGARGAGLADTGVGSAQATGRILVKNLTDWYATYTGLSKSAHFVARCPGDNGNSLQVIISSGAVGTSEKSFDDVTDETETNKLKALVRANFDAAPGSLNSSLKDEIHVLVIDRLGLISGTPNNVIEKFQGLSLLTDSKEGQGVSNYYFDVINNQSQFIYVNKLGDATDGLFTGADKTIAAAGTTEIASHTDTTADDSMDTGGFRNGVFNGIFALGQDGDMTAADYQAGINLFADADTVDVNLLLAGSGILAATAQITVDNHLITTATDRKDAVAFVSPGVGSGGSAANGLAVETQTTEALKLAAVKLRREKITNLNSYSVMDSSPLYVYNKYADNFEFIAASGHIAGLCARTDGTNDPWFSPAGFNRGNLVGVTKLAFNPNQSSRDALYKAQINPLCAFPGNGIILFGDKTGQVKPSAFDRINVRRLFIVLEKAISTASKFSLFELNDEFTRAQFRNLVEPFLRDVKGRRGVTDFLVVCDETNNTGQVIDTNRFVADIFIKPARSINFITLSFVATRTGVEFSELTN